MSKRASKLESESQRKEGGAFMADSPDESKNSMKKERKRKNRKVGGKEKQERKGRRQRGVGENERKEGRRKEGKKE